MSNPATAWGLFVVGLVSLFVMGFFVMFLGAQAATGCDQFFSPEQTHPAFCDSPVTRSLLVFLPLILGAVYVVGSVVGIILLKGSRWSWTVPVGLALAVVLGLVIELVTIS